jgi:phospholipase/lecithinase/hemolysin
MYYSRRAPCPFNMRKRVFAVAILTLVLPLFAALGDPISQVNQIVAFGDSLTDTGNVSIATGGILPGSGYAAGEYTNPPAPGGPSGLWIDQFATKAGLPDPQPTLAGGTNYAVAGADTGLSSSCVLSYALCNVSDEVNRYLVGRSNVPSTSLYSFWAGANDIFDALKDGSNPITAAATAADNLEANIATLAGEGGKYFLWFNLPLLGDTPRGQSLGPVAAGALNLASTTFDTDMAGDIKNLDQTGIVVVRVDIETLFNDIVNVPGHDGFNLSPEPKGAALNGYLFSWDGLHPTSDADALIADLALTDFEAVPEPANAGLVLIGFCGLLAVARHLKPKNRG